jgi:hypothetical protein
MIALISFLLAILASPFRSKSDLVAENELLRQQVLVLRRKVKGRVPFRNGDPFTSAFAQSGHAGQFDRTFLERWAGQPRRRSLNAGARDFGQGQSWLTCNDEVDRLRTFALLVGLDIIADPLPLS